MCKKHMYQRLLWVNTSHLMFTLKATLNPKQNKTNKTKTTAFGFQGPHVWPEYDPQKVEITDSEQHSVHFRRFSIVVSTYII